MDNLDSLSDCSESSRLSTFSNLSEYQTEFLELKQLINSDAGLTESRQSNILATNIIQWYEKQISNLNSRLQNSLKANENYKSVGTQKEIAFSDKLEKLLKRNQLLENNLLEANKQIERLISICNNNNRNDQVVFLEEKILNLERTNNDLVKQNFDLANDRNEITNDYKNLKTEINELKLELAAKNNTIAEFKRKVSEQHVGIEELNQEKNKLEHSLELISNELDYVKKSETWYKTELKQIQQQRASFSKNNLEKEKIRAAQEEQIEQLKLELSCLKCNYDEFKLATLKEKESILRRFEVAAVAKTEKPTSDFGSLQTHYESTISDLTEDMKKIKADFQRQQTLLEKISQEKSEYLTKYLSEKSKSDEKQQSVEILESNVKDLKSKLSSILDRERQQNVDLLNLRKTCESLKIELNSKAQDKKEFDESVNTIREQVKILMSKYAASKIQLQKRNQDLLKLQQTKEQILLEKAREISELTGDVDKKVAEIRELKEKIIYLEAAKTNAETDKNIQGNVIENLNNAIIKLQEDLNNKTPPNPDTNLLDALKHICEIGNINLGGESPTVDNLLEKIQAHFETKPPTKKLAGKFLKLAQKCKYLENKTEQNRSILKALFSERNSNLNEEIQRLQTQLQVKLQEDKDKQKRYERNYRTLLRKVKEHMKGRKAAEKHNLYLQELHNNLSSECSSFKLTLSQTRAELEENRLLAEKFKQKLKQREQIEALRNDETKAIEKLKDENDRLVREITKSDQFIEDNNKLSAKIKELESSLSEEKTVNGVLRKTVDDLKARSGNDILKLSRQIDDIKEKNSVLFDDIQHLNSCLQLKSEEIDELKAKRNQYSRMWAQKELNLTNLIADLKKQTVGVKSELDFCKNEKFFLQRLCQDLRIALRTYAGQNQALRDFILKLCKVNSDEPCSILQNFPSPAKYDDGHIDKLLEENTPNQDKTCDIDESLRALRKEILFLQQQIVEKNLA